MHGWLYVKPRGSLPPLFDIQYGSMIAAGVEYDRYRRLARVSPLITVLRGYLILSPRVTSPSTIRTITRVASHTTGTGAESGAAFRSYGNWTVTSTPTNTTRTDRDEPIVFGSNPFLLPSASARPIPNELVCVKL